MQYGYSKKLDMDFNQAVLKTKDALRAEGFGALTEIDVREILGEKLGVEYGNYLIIGACNPPFAYEALRVEKEIGLLLPCNVIVYEGAGEVAVSAILPTVAMGVVGNEELKGIAREVEGRLKKAINSIA